MFAIASLAGCANRCDYAQTKCQYECNRNYQVCELHGNDELYCHNEIGNCMVACTDHPQQLSFVTVKMEIVTRR